MATIASSCLPCLRCAPSINHNTVDPLATCDPRKMSRISYATQPVFVDEVIQRDEPSQVAYEALHRQGYRQNLNHLPNTGINRASLPLPQTQPVLPEIYRRPFKSARTLSMPSNTMSSPVGQRERLPNSRSLRKPPTRPQQKQGINESASTNGTTLAPVSTANGANMSNMTDFFNPEVFHMVLHNPATAHRFLRYCQSRACGENIEFLQKVCFAKLSA